MDSVAKSVINNTKQLIEVNAKLQEQINQGGGGSGGATEAKQDDMINELQTIAGDTTSLDTKITTGADVTLTSAQQVLAYGEVTSGPGTGELHPIHITQAGDVEVEIAGFVKGAETGANSFPVVLSTDGTYATAAKQDLHTTELEAINTGVGSIDDKITVGSDDTLSQAQQVLNYARKDMTPSGLRAMKCADDGTLHNYDTGLNMKISSGSELTLSSVQQVGTYAWDGSNFRRIVANDVLNSLLVSSLKEVPVTSTETLTPGAGGTALSSAIDLAGYSLLTIQGTSDNTTDSIELLTSIDNVTYRKDGTFLIQQDFTTGDFSVSLNNIATRYLKIRQIDSVSTAFTMVVETSRR